MFVRSSDLKQLESCFQEEDNRLLFLYGKRECEKEALIREFLVGKQYFYFRAQPASSELQKEMLCSKVERDCDATIGEVSYAECFRRVHSNGPGRLVIVIEEIQNIMRKDEAFFEAIKALKGKKLYPGPVMILLTSSSIVWSEGTFLEKANGFRRTVDAVLKVDELNFIEIVRAFPSFTVAESVGLYGVIGGVPEFMRHWNPRRTLRQNVCELILTQGGFLFGKAEEIILSELRELSVYNTILAAIASGKNKLNDLYLATGFSRAKISVYMRNLAQFDIVRKNVSFETGGWDNAQKGIYEICDTFVHFWYRFVYPNISDLYIMRPEAFYDKYIANEIDAYLTRYFVDVCKEYLILLNQLNRLPVSIAKIGSWTGKSGKIDIIAQSPDRRNLIGMCNWELGRFPMETLRQLADSMEKARVSAEKIYLFSAKSFEQELIEYAKADERIELVDMKEL